MWILTGEKTEKLGESAVRGNALSDLKSESIPNLCISLWFTSLTHWAIPAAIVILNLYQYTLKWQLYEYRLKAQTLSFGLRAWTKILHYDWAMAILIYRSTLISLVFMSKLVYFSVINYWSFYCFLLAWRYSFPFMIYDAANIQWPQRKYDFGDSGCQETNVKLL